MPVDHPSYKSPSIGEALCEIQFTGEAGQPWDPAWFGDIYTSIKEEWPVFEPTPVGLRFSHRSRPLFLQLSPGKIVVNLLPQYPGWDQMRTDVLMLWERVSGVVNPRSVTRMELRYINAIEIQDPSETLERWFVPTEYIPSVVLGARRGSLSQIQAIKNEYRQINVALGERIQVLDQSNAFILDINVAEVREIDPSLKIIMDLAEDIHNEIWTIFNDAKSLELERLLKGELL